MPLIAFDHVNIRTVHLDEMLTRYYEVRGWDEQGRPTEEKLRELGLVSY